MDKKKHCVVEECIKSDLFIEGQVVLFVAKNDPKWRLEECSRNFADLTGYSPKEVKRNKLGILDLVHPEDREKFIKDFYQVRQKGEESWSFQNFRLLGKNKKPVWAEIRISIIKDNSGKVSYFVGYLIDVTEITEDKNLFETITELVPVGIFLREDDKIIYANKRSIDIIGYTPKELYRVKSVFSLVYPEDRHIVDEIIKRRKEGDSSVITYRIRIITKEGKIKWVQITSKTITYQGKELAIGTVQDIDRMVNLEFAKNILVNINRAMLSIKDRFSLLDAVCDIFREEEPFNGVIIYEIEDGKMSPICAYSKKSFFKDMNWDRSPEEKVLTINRPLYLSDIERLKGYEKWKSIMVKNGVKSLIILPIKPDKKNVKYVISLYIKEKDYFSKEMLDIFSEIAKDISFTINHLKQEEDLFFKEFYDQLTGVGNRAYMLKTLEKYINKNRSFYIILLDIYNFRYINEKYGKEFGDSLLKTLAKTLDKELVYENVFRVGGDEFAIVTYSDDIYSTVNKIREVLGSLNVNGKRLKINFNMGIARFPEDSRNLHDLILKTERVLDLSRKEGKNRISFFEREKYDSIISTLSLEEKLERAIRNDEFILFFQPILSIKSSSIKSFEVLIRWKDREKIILPTEFIPVAEKTGQVVEIDRLVLRKVLNILRKWKDKKIKFPSGKGRYKTVNRLKLSVNITPKYINETASFLESLSKNDLKLLKDHVVIEITERESLHIYEEKDGVDRLRKLGFKISIDDFGTGYSSLSYLSELKVKYIKIDKLFINKMLKNRKVHRLVQSIINIAKIFKIKTVAEGVETDQQLEELKKLECDMYQGFIFSPPVSQEDMERFIVEDRG